MPVSFRVEKAGSHTCTNLHWNSMAMLKRNDTVDLDRFWQTQRAHFFRVAGCFACMLRFSCEVNKHYTDALFHCTVTPTSNFHLLISYWLTYSFHIACLAFPLVSLSADSVITQTNTSTPIVISSDHPDHYKHHKAITSTKQATR